ncbi:MAG TPA: hypothetical protein VKV39_11260 [Candidatus Sulfotelmatobacter sp.]|nr:hypothetical protein [Candidatus Sulfotelmatobacter sp.]
MFCLFRHRDWAGAKTFARYGISGFPDKSGALGAASASLIAFMPMSSLISLTYWRYFV